MEQILETLTELNPVSGIFVIEKKKKKKKKKKKRYMEKYFHLVKFLLAQSFNIYEIPFHAVRIMNH